MTKERITRICSIENCGERHEAKSYCRKHYQRFLTYGDPLRERPFLKCKVDTCTQQRRLWGYCAKHAQRWKLYGDPKQLYSTFGSGDTPQERFWSKVDKTPGLGRDGDCWEWRGGVARPNAPYGSFTLHRKQWRAHRLALFWATGKKPVLSVLHSCDNQRCVNPDHLREGTHQENMDDKVSRNRTRKGEKHGMAKLTVENIREIRAMADSGVNYKEIAHHFKISATHAAGIAKRERWKHIE